ncbi:uncharacterized protein DS421_11g325950 [Arachis hypogaea]|nr:uncharacterized protein DS421_11g325950 [Arachis hypogaea]
MTTGRGVTNRPHDHGRRRVFIGTPKTSRSSPSISTIPGTSQAVGAQDQPFIMVSNPNYVAPAPPPLSQPGSHQAASREWTPPPPPSAQQLTVSTTTPPLTTDTMVPKFLTDPSQMALY